MSIGIEKVPMGIFFDLKSVRKSGGEWSCGEKAIGFVKEHLEEHKKENHAVIARLNKASYFLFVSPKR